MCDNLEIYTGGWPGVSVSLWSIIHSYTWYDENTDTYRLLVSVSLWSIIHSYFSN